MGVMFSLSQSVTDSGEPWDGFCILSMKALTWEMYILELEPVSGRYTDAGKCVEEPSNN